MQTKFIQNFIIPQKSTFVIVPQEKTYRREWEMYVFCIVKATLKTESQSTIKCYEQQKLNMPCNQFKYVHQNPTIMTIHNNTRWESKKAFWFFPFLIRTMWCDSISSNIILNMRNMFKGNGCVMCSWWACKRNCWFGLHCS